MKIRFIIINAPFILDHVFDNIKTMTKGIFLYDFEKAFDSVNWNFLFKTLKFILGKFLR